MGRGELVRQAIAATTVPILVARYEGDALAAFAPTTDGGIVGFAGSNIPCHPGSVRFLCLAAAIALLSPTESARACSYVLSLDLGEPADGATDVPTNVVPWLRGVAGTAEIGTGGPPGTDGGVSGIAVSMRMSGGAEVPLTVVTLQSGGDEGRVTVELRPTAELAPNTTYVIDVDSGYEAKSFTFTTGDGPIGDVPGDLGPLRMQVANRSPGSCGDNTFACVDTPEGQTVRASVTTTDGSAEAELISGARGSFSYSRRAPSARSPFCVELRARNPAGTLGEPTTVCSSGAATFSTDTTDAIYCEAGRLRTSAGYLDEGAAGAMRTDDSGCAAAGSGAPGWASVALLALLSLRRRGRIRPSRGG